MFDFVSYANDSGVQITIKPGNGKDLCTLEIIDKTGCKESETVTAKEIRQAENIDRLLGRVLDRMAARIGSKKAAHYSAKRFSVQMAEREKFFKKL